MIWPRVSGPASRVAISSSRSREVAGSSSVIDTTGMSLSSCFMIWSSGADSTSTTMVIRLNRSLSEGATARLKMLYPRRENSPATRASTPALFSTRTVSVWWRLSAP